MLTAINRVEQNNATLKEVLKATDTTGRLSR
jgi:hypothetical protein